jgi:type IV pilus assembly protein PilE
MSKPSTLRFAARKAAGFTLIELMVTVAIVAILASIATTSYQSQIRKSRRTDARTALLDIAGREERIMSVTTVYSALPSDLGYGTAATWAAVGAIGSGYYTLAVNVGTGPPATYTIIATTTGTQTSDAACATLSVNQLGQQMSTDSGGNVTTSGSACWK